jgi:hypothetical protein
VASIPDHGPPTSPTLSAQAGADPVVPAFWLLRTGFTVAPTLFGLDKVAGLLTDGERYLATVVTRSGSPRGR